MKIHSRRYTGKVLGIVISLVLAGAVSACNKKPTTISGVLLFIQGQVINDGTVAAVLDGIEVAEAQVDPANGRFLITVSKSGNYTLRLKHPKIAPFDFFSEIVIKKGDQIILDPYPAPNEILENPHATAAANSANTNQSTQEAHVIITATVKGMVHPQNSTIRILDGDRVVAEGKAKGSFFSIPSVPVGTYDIEYSFPRFATIYHRKVSVTAGGAGRELNAYLLFTSAIDGVNWQKGVAITSGKAEANPSMPRNQAIVAACQSAKTKAYSNMAEALIQIQTEPGKPLSSISSGDTMKFKLTGFIQTSGSVSESKNKDGSCEVSLQIPLQGAGSLTNFIQKQMGRDRRSY